MQEIDQYLNEMTAVLKRYGIRHASIFGSFSKGTNTSDSDVDMLIEPGDNFTLFNLLLLEEELKELTNRNIDLVEFGAIKQSIKNEVLQSAIPIL
ncbi:nucleotidyltransferase domain-containing protein [uncultured Mucilaginibacter sp.]|uniref:nucleotidyltransferase family protein n=1 Tax=uncultured Mucilaginibacter sp. TaxID=797541 RepID=UPI0025CCEE27|nr:nucleotidyltransferase domain-containing protein [uncultured Mucilaginibacter sp.]